MTTRAAAVPLLLSVHRARARARERSTIEQWGIWLGVLSLAVAGAGMVIGFSASLGILTAMGFFVAIVGMNKPGVGLIGISMLCTMDNMSRALLFTRGPFPWNTFNYWLLVVLLLSVIPLLKFNDPQTRIMQLLTGLLLFGLLISPMVDIGEETVLNVIAYFALLMYFYKSRASDPAFYWQAMVSGILGAATGLVYYVQQAQLPYVNPNSWAYLPLTAIFAVAIGFRSAPLKGRGQLYLGLLATVNITWVFLSGSRGSLLTGLICMVFIIASIRKKSQRFGFVFVGGALVVAVIIAFGTQNQFAFRRLDKLFNENESMVGRTSGRSDLMKGGWLVFQDNPFGVGTGGFATAWARLGFRSELTGFSYGENREAHAGWIKILAENGFLGFFILVALVVSFVVKGWQLKRRGLFPLGLFMTTVLSFAWVSTEFASKGIWFLVAGATALLNMKKSPPRVMRRPVPALDQKKV